MKKIIFSVVLLTVLVHLTSYGQAFVHPGILNNQSELDFVKAKIQANQQPWLQAFNALKSSSYSSLTYVAKPYATVSCGSHNNPNVGCSQIVDDGMAAYSLALMWSYTGDIRYATKSIAIINAWSTTFQNITTETNQRLVVSWAAPWYTNAAEILRYSNSGWTNTNLTNFNGFLAKMLPYIKDDTMPGNNWVQSAIEAHLAISIFTDNRTEFNTAVARWKVRVKTYIYQTTDGATPFDYPSGHVNINSSKWNGTKVFINGLCMETCRDLGHMKLGFNSMMYAAQSAYEQGVDLFTIEQKRLSDFLELHGSWMTGATAVPSNINGGYVIAAAPDVVGIKPPTGGGASAFEIAYNHLHSRLNKNLPYTLQMINAHRPAGAGHWVFKWETLTHGNLPFNISNPSNNPPAISITSPQGSIVNCSPVSITINAIATDDHGVQKVEFYNGTTLLNTDNSSPFTYTWNSVSTGSYSITAKAYDASNLNTTSNTVTINVASLPTIVHKVNVNGTWLTANQTTACMGSTILFGPWPALATGWNWTGPNGFTSSQRDPTLTNITTNQSGIYTAKYTDPNGCSSISIFNLQIDALPTATITSLTNSFCAGGSVALTASTGNTYKWFNGTTPVGTAATYSANSPGNYTVEVTNAANCSATSAIKTINSSALPTATITSPSNSFCAGGSVVLTASTGTSYKWFNGTTPVGIAATYTANSPGNYTVEVTNAANCTATSVVKTITANPLPVITNKVKVDATWSTANQASTCEGSAITLGPWPAVPAGWNWTGPNGFTSTQRDPTLTSASTNQTGIYTATYIDPNGCSATSTFNLQINTAPTATITSPSNSFCTGSSIVLTSTAGSSYKWFKDGAAITESTNSISVNQIGSYSVEVTNANGCKAISGTKVITIDANPTATINSTSNSLCAGSSLILTASSGTSYKWFKDGVVLTETTNTTSVNQAGSYTLEVTNNGGCKAVSVAKNILITSTMVWYADTDGDGTGDASTTLSACTQPVGYVSASGDKCPTDANKINPGLCGCGVLESSCTNQAQTITFTPFNANQNVGDPDFELSATSSSGLTITFTSSNPNVAIIIGNKVQIVGAGTTIITATQSGNAFFSASNTTQSLTISTPIKLGVLQVLDGNTILQNNGANLPIGSAPINTQSLNKIITLKNIGTSVIIISGLSATSGFTVSQENISNTIQPNKTLSISIMGIPTDINTATTGIILITCENSSQNFSLNVSVDVSRTTSTLGSLLASKIELFPNPTTGNMNLTFNDTFEDVFIQLFSLEGKLIQTQEIGIVSYNQRQLSIHELPNGIYFLEIQTKQGTLVKRVIKQ